MKNSVLGSTFIVAGTALGAGMLAMPIATVGSGFGVSFVMLIVLWLVMSYTALLLVEAYQHCPAETGLSTLSKIYLGSLGQWITGLALPFLMYSLVAAYLSGGGDLITSALNQTFKLHLPTQVGVIGFTILGGAIVYIGTRSVDLVNRLLFTLKIIFLVGMLLLLLPHIQLSHLTQLPVHQALILSAIPIVFTSFGFHGSIPSIVHYMGGHTKKLRIIFIMGSAIPLLVYILWLLATLGTIYPETLMKILNNKEQSSLLGLLQAIKIVVNTNIVEMSVRFFAALALATSFLGVALGLFDFLADCFKRANNLTGRLQTSLITFIPPLFFALFYRQGFIFALGFAAIALAVLSLILPALLVYQTRKKHQGGYQVKGGICGLAIVFLLGIAIILIQLLIITGYLPNVG